MALTVDQILAEARKLPAEDRERVIDALAETIDAEGVELSPAWKQEIGNRIAQIEGGEVELLDGDAVMRELQERFPDR